MNEEDSLNFAYHSSSMLLKMEPEEQEGADVALSLSEKMLTMYKEEIDGLKRGDRVMFNATIM